MGDRVAQSRAGGASLAALPSRSLLLCGAHGHPPASLGPALGQPSVGDLGLFSPPLFLLAGAGQVVLIGRATLATPYWLARAQLEVAQLLGMQRGPDPGIVLALGQHVPQDHRQLAGDGNGSDVVAPPRRDPLVECS